MNTGHNAYFVILLVTNVLALQCPTNKECHCELNKLDNLNNFWIADINCTMDNNSVFNIFIKEGSSYYILIICINSSDLSDLNLDIRNIMFYIRNENEIEFEDCNLSKSIKLIDIVRVKEVRSANKLRFKSYKKLNLTLEKRHLNGFENLEELEIRNYNIFHMDEDLLSDFKELRFLALANNILEQPLTAKYIDNSAKLEKLFLNNNNLRLIEPSIFDKLKNLTDLMLKNNSLTELRPGIFDNLVALKILDISMNNLSTLPKDIFAKMENLTHLHLNGNNFIKLPRDLLRNNIKLEAVYLYDNQRNLTLCDGFFSNLTKLHTLTLTNNGLITLPEDLFWESASLSSIKLNNNYLESLPQKIFWDSRMLMYLYLDSNNLEILPDYIFTNTSQLSILNLSNNRITFISNELFDGLKRLEELNMERNHLRTVSDYSFSSLRSLRIINLSHNDLILQSDRPYIYSPFFDCSKLIELYLANNSISKILDYPLSTL